MKILVACEYSGTVRDAFIKAGHEAISCDLLPTDKTGPHIQGDVREILRQKWDMLIAFPDCTYLCGSGWHWVKRGRIEGDGRPRAEHAKDALSFVLLLASANIPRIAIENPVGKLSTLWRKPDQIIQPYRFGDNASKATCLWLKGLPNLKPTRFIEPRVIGSRNRWANQTDSGQNKLPASADRWKIRSTTYQGIANAMADQWSKL